MHGTQLRIEGRPGSNYFALIGQLDLSTVGILEDSFDGDAGDGEVIFDLSRLAFIDVAGLHALVRIGRSLAKRRRYLTLHDPSPELMVMAKVLGEERLTDSIRLRRPSEPAVRSVRRLDDGYSTAV
jgi:anti-anti-sigma regulatory factor